VTIKDKLEYKATFFLLCVFFVFNFYFLPLLVFSFVGEVEYLGNLYHFSGLWGMLFSLFVFMLGFYLMSKVKLMAVGDGRSGSVGYSAHPILWVVVIVLFTVFWAGFFDSQRSEQIYLVRKGELEGSHLEFFLGVVISGLAISTFLALVNVNARFIALVFMLSFLAYQLTGAVGRTNLLLTVFMIAMLFLKFRPRQLVFLVFCVFLLLVPLILSLKALIYLFSVNELTMSAFSSVSFDFDAYFESFGHVLFSYFSRSDFIDSCGYRYFYDYVQGFLFYLKVFGLDFGSSITYCNTQVMMSVEESIIPPGFILLGYAQLGGVGVFTAGVLYFLVGVLGFYSLKFAGNIKREAIFFVSFICANSFYHGDLRTMVLTLFLPLFFVAVGRFFVRERRKC